MYDVRMIVAVLQALVLVLWVAWRPVRHWWAHQVARGAEIKASADALDADPDYDVVSQSTVFLPDSIRSDFS